MGAHYVQGGDLGRARWHRAGSGHGDSRDWGVFGGRGCCGGSVPPCVPSPGPYRTRPLVFLSTEAAKLCVTPTRLVPSTSTIRSFTWILGTRGPSRRCHPLPTSPASPPKAHGGAAAGVWGRDLGPGTPYLPSRWAAPPSVTVLTKMPSFSRPMSAPAPMPMMLIPSPSESAETESCVPGVAAVAASTRHQWGHLGSVPEALGSRTRPGPTFLQLHGEEVEALHPLLQLVLGRRSHGVDVLIAAVVVLVGVSAEDLAWEVDGGMERGVTDPTRHRRTPPAPQHGAG